MKIHQLPDTLANKIAAGEVVERPASVVKELVENSIDANSSYIKVTLQEAGLQEIAVTDNGDGISEADCKRAFLRHATSKIKYDTDLFHIKSLGFRGEALASIASVSKLTLTSSEGDHPATCIYLEAGEIMEESRSDARKGTEIVVNDLFYNTPARLKYIKSIHTELGHITDLINRYALGYPKVRFELFHNDKLIFKTTGSGNKVQVISQIYGVQVARNVLHAETSTLDFDIEAFVVKPEITRANRRYVTLIVNGRYIRNFVLTKAIIDGYGTLLPIHRYPIAIIYINLDPVLVDVNVHPTKLEVRFSKEKELAKTLEQLVREIFKKETLIPKMTESRRDKRKTEQEAFHLHMPIDFDKHMDDFLENRSEMFTEGNQTDGIKQSKNKKILQDDSDSHNPRINQYRNEQQVNETIKPLQTNERNEDSHTITELNVNTIDRIPPLYPIGQLQGTYILAQNELGFYMIDQHAAQERIKYEFFKKQLGEPEADEQQLLMPLQFEFTPEEVILIEQYEAEFRSVGVSLEHFGGNTYTVRSHPTWFPKGEEEQIIRDIVHQVIEDGAVNIEALREEVAILMACKRSIKANHHLTMQDMERLLDDLRKTEDPFTCPHGRPVIIHQTYYEIEKMFKRIM